MSFLPIRRLDASATVPTRAHPDDAGLDLYALEDFTFGPRQGGMVRTGVAVAVPSDHVGLVCDRSSMAKRGMKTLGGVIDAGYRGELGVVIWNLGTEPQSVKKGERIAQLLIMPIAVPVPQETGDLGDTARGAGGFGSTGR